MDFSWSDAQNELYNTVIDFARRKLNRDVQQRDREHRFAAEEWRLCGDFGLQGLCIAEEYGGMGHDVLTTTRAVEALGRGCEDMGLLFSITAHLFACAVPISEYAPAQLKAKVLPGLASGKLIGANAITEAEAGSDIFGLKTSAVRDGDSYVLNGTKTYVTNAPVADLFLVYGMTNPDFGYMGINAFVVPKGTEGLTVGQPFDKVGLATSPTGSIYLDDCRVPVSSRVGGEGQGAQVFTASMHWERASLFAGYVGNLDRQLEQVVAYAKERRQFGQALGKNQAISHRIAEMKLRLEAARLLLYRACWLRDQGETATMEVAMAKIAISEAAVQSGLDAIQILGGNGVVREYDVERHLRDALPCKIFSGTSEIQRNLIARELGL